MTEAAEIMRRRGANAPVDIAMVLGTGLGSLAEALEDALSVPYGELPGFPHSGVSGHAGKLAVGTLEGVRVAILQGRNHYYESGDARAMAVPLETVAALGARSLLLTNSAGGLNKLYGPGTVYIVTDHINFSGSNPLIGDATDARFVSMTGAYDKRLRERLHRAAAGIGMKPQDGVYMWFSGPSFETPAEVRMARLLGADLVGMSTVPEVILARRLGLKVAALSLVTNFGAGMTGGDLSHDETKQVALSGAIAMRRLLRGFLKARDD